MRFMRRTYRPLQGLLGIAFIFLLTLFNDTRAALTPTHSDDTRDRIFIVGQDLSAIRGYFSSQCCIAPDGVTTYLDFYELRNPDAGFGGLGMDNNGRFLTNEHSWGAGPVNAYISLKEADVPYISIGLSLTENEHPGGLDKLASGALDENIDKLGDFISSIHATVLLRIGYEFDGAWNKGYENKARFIQVYRRIAERLKKRGLQNVAFVWQGSAASVDIILDQGRLDDMRDWYPGDDVVDWVGLSWFMQPNEQPSVSYEYPVPTPVELSTNLINIAKAHKKPVLIAEASPQAFDLSANTTAYHSPIWDGPSAENIQTLTPDQIWRQWYQPLFDLIAAHPETIRGLAYINVRWQDQAMWGPPYSSGYWGDSRLEVNPTIAKKFNEAVTEWKTSKGNR